MLAHMLSIQTYSQILYTLCLSFTASASTLVFILCAQSVIKPSYRLSLAFCNAALFTASVHAGLLLINWHYAYACQDGLCLSTGSVFHEGYRYWDHLLSLPFIILAFISLIQETKQLNSLALRLVCALVASLSLWELSSIVGAQYSMAALISGMLSMLYVLYVLWFELKPILRRELHDIWPYLSLTRIVLMLSWPLYGCLSLLHMHAWLHFSSLQLLHTAIHITARILPIWLCFLLAYIASQHSKCHQPPV